MPFTPNAFLRLLEPLDRRTVSRAVAHHDGDRGVGGGEHAWSCARHLKRLLFAQWTGLDSLRRIAAALAGQSGCSYHLGLRPPRRSTLSDANTQRPAAVFAEIAAGLAHQLAHTLGQDPDSLVRLLDWASIMVKDERFAWAGKSARIRGLKLHVLYDPRADRPGVVRLELGQSGRCGGRPRRAAREGRHPGIR